MGFSRRAACVFLGALLSQVVLTAPSRGAFIVYTSEADFNAATFARTTVDFTGIAPVDDFVTVPVPPGQTVNSINFTINTAQSNGSLFVVDAGFSNNFFGATLLDSQFSTTTNDNILITLPTAVTAAAFYFGSSIGLDVNFLASNGDSITATTTDDVIQFLGVTSNTPFTTIELSEGLGGGLALQSFTSATAVPEPSSLSMLAIGVLAAAGFHQSRRRTSA
jgi:hypothetical protein